MLVIKHLDALSKQTRIGLAKDLKDPSALNILAKDPDPYVRATVAQNVYANQSTYDELANDPDPYVRYKVAKNPKTELETLKKLKKDSYVDVKMAANRALNDLVSK